MQINTKQISRCPAGSCAVIGQGEHPDLDFFQKQGGNQILACHVYVHSNQLLLLLPAGWGSPGGSPCPVCVVWCLAAKLESNLSNALCPHRPFGQQPSCTCLCVQVLQVPLLPWECRVFLWVCALSVGPELKQLRWCHDVPLPLLSLINSGIIRVHSCPVASWICFLASELCFMSSRIESPFQKHC